MQYMVLFFFSSFFFFFSAVKFVNFLFQVFDIFSFFYSEQIVDMLEPVLMTEYLLPTNYVLKQKALMFNLYQFEIAFISMDIAHKYFDLQDVKIFLYITQH